MLYSHFSVMVTPLLGGEESSLEESYLILKFCLRIYRQHYHLNYTYNI